MSEGKTPARHDVADKPLRTRVFERDDHTCQFCGFKSKKYQEVVFRNPDVQTKTLDNLVTACIFCHQVHHLEKVSDLQGGVLIWLPEMGQSSLHHLARAIFVARITTGAVATAAQNALVALQSRTEAAEERIGTSDPSVLATVLQDFTNPDVYQQRSQKLKGIRLLPYDRRIVREGELEFNQFPQILAYWRSKDGPYGSLLPTTWIDRFNALSGQTA